MSEQSEITASIDAALQLKWGSPLAAEYGDESPDPIHLEVGRSLSQWETMEVFLGQIYQLMCQGRYSEGLMGAASRTYGLINSAGVRKSVLSEIADIYAIYVDREFDLSRFKGLLEHYDKGSRLRNHLAHGYVSSMSVDDRPHGHYLTPAAYSTKNNFRVDQWEKFRSSAPKPDFPSLKYLYSSSDIAKIRSQFEVLTKGCGVFHNQILIKKVSMLSGTHAINPTPSIGPESNP